MGSFYKCVNGYWNVRFEVLINVWMDVGMFDGKIL